MKMCIFGFNKMTELKLHVKTWDQLDLDTWYAISRLRNAVFVVEQDCVYQDLDGVDSHSKHVYLTDSEQHIAAYARIVPKGLIYPEHSIGRVLVDDQNRGRQLGRRLMKACMEVVEKISCLPSLTLTPAAEPACTTATMITGSLVVLVMTLSLVMIKITFLMVVLVAKP